MADRDRASVLATMVERFQKPDIRQDLQSSETGTPCCLELLPERACGVLAAVFREKRGEGAAAP